ncbi:radical SAM/SPASM domain-containing protein [Argonema galeatum]|uniref:radical SAM/SPASM domain-containing protein n=1 Tax=Argonema galeatum TaxID=2942762 RepID=UPI00201118C0|nr:radical SAM/SPASM domain-containing protein [Argonema galeatum]MCL1464461.1 radical SAM protein [Argonema galeatum A003/A1]
MLSNLKSIISPRLRSQVKSIVQAWERRQDHWLDVISTEYNFRFRRWAIQEQLEKIRSLPRALHIEATNTCNARCTFCAYPQMERAKQVMPLEDFRRIIDEYVAMGGKYVSMTPIVGDPFVDPHLFARLDDLYKRPEIEGFYFYTNAILMKPQVSEKLLVYGDKLKVHVSWGGFDRETYKAIMGVDRFDTVSRNVEAFVEAKRTTNSPINFTIALRCPLSKCRGELWKKFRLWEREGLLNIEHLDSYDSWAGKIKAEDLQAIGLQPRQMPHKRGACEMLYMKPAVLANGKVNACACRDVEAELIVGDLKESNLSEVWEGKAIEEIIDRHEQSDFPDVCQRCTWYVSVYNQRKSIVLKPLLNWSEDSSHDSLKLY